jgi:hypothetical protein
MPGLARANSASVSAERAEAATLTPCRTSATANARPMPVLAPVIQAVRHRAGMASGSSPQVEDEPSYAKPNAAAEA